MKRRLRIAALVVVLVLIATSIYVLFAGFLPLYELRGVLRSDVSTVSEGDLTTALTRLQRADAALTNPAVRLLDVVPVGRQNVAAARDVVDRAIPAVEVARSFLQLRERFEKRGLTVDGTIDLEALDRVHDVVAEQATALDDMRQAADARRNGWLVPPVWEALAELARETASRIRSAEAAERALSVADALFGEAGPRTYLVLLLNNAELRGAGGIVSGIGTLHFDEGVMTVGDFDYYADIAGRGPLRRVSAPADFRRRFGRYKADTTLWINASASPDIPEVAEVTKKLYELSNGVTTDGVLFVDPRGLASFLGPSERVTVPDAAVSVTGAELADFVYKRAYSLFKGNRRREVLLSLGPKILKRALEGGRDIERFGQIAEAAAGGHIRFVAFATSEDAALADLELDWSLERGTHDGVLVTVQNLGADKLDAWVQRTVEVHCDVDPDAVAHCSIDVVLRNTSPEGLPLYVVQDKESYALQEGYIEVYVPERAEVTSYSLNDVSPEVFIEPEDGWKSLGAYFETERGEATTAVVTYDLAIGSALDLTLVPQPLTQDAEVKMSVSVPDGWTIEGPGGSRNDSLIYEGPLDAILTLRAAPTRDESTGLTRMWRSLTRFWSKPIVRF